MPTPRSRQRDAFVAARERIRELKLHPDDETRLGGVADVLSRGYDVAGPLEREIAAELVVVLGEMKASRDLRTRIRGFGEVTKLMRQLGVGGVVRAATYPAATPARSARRKRRRVAVEEWGPGRYPTAPPWMLPEGSAARKEAIRAWREAGLLGDEDEQAGSSPAEVEDNGGDEAAGGQEA